MDDRTFDALTRAIATPRSRRAALKAMALGLGAGAFATRRSPALADSDCAMFCRNLPPGQRGQCVSSCQAGTGPYFECGGDPSQLCLAGDGQSTTCCGAGTTCQDGSCVVVGCSDNYVVCEASGDCVSTLCGAYGVFDPATCACDCYDYAAYCAQRDQCVSTYCDYRKEYNPDTCTCECPPQYIPLVNTGMCATPCDSDADCGDYPGGCRTNVEGQKVCGNCGQSAWHGCTDYYPCTSSAFCQACGAAINTYCAEGVCYTAC